MFQGPGLRIQEFSCRHRRAEDSTFLAPGHDQHVDRDVTTNKQVAK